MRRGFIALAICVLSSVGVDCRASQTVLVSKAPYWSVGDRDDALSRACSLNKFNPSRPGDLLAKFDGPQGGGILDVAKGTGLNLKDPGHLAKPNEDYFFR